MNASSFDLIVVGGGPGGYVAAIRATQLGLKTALVEQSELGGICLNWGCIPAKALLRSADVLRQVKNAAAFGVHVDAPRADLDAMVKRSRAVSAQLSRGVTHLMKKNGVTVFNGKGRLLPVPQDEAHQASSQSRQPTAGSAPATHRDKARKTIEVTAPDGVVTRIDAPDVIIATGARARQLPMLPPDGNTVWTYRDALLPPFLPKRLLIVGAGAIGIEFASFYHAVGVDVTVIEMAERILPVEDAEVSAQVASSLTREGIVLRTGVRLDSAVKTARGWQLTLSSLSRAGSSEGSAEGSQSGGAAERVEGDAVLVAAGIVGNVENVGLEGTAVVIEKTHIVTDAFGQTGEPGVHAIGDVAGAPWLAHKASHEGVICVEKIAGLDPHPIDPSRIAACTYSHPQVASVGFTEAQAKAHAAANGYAIKVGKFPFVANGKAIAMGSTTGFVKVVFNDRTGELLGAHMVGDEVTEMIQGYVIGQTLETTETELTTAILPHPTMSEAMHEAVLAAYGRALHI